MLDSRRDRRYRRVAHRNIGVGLRKVLSHDMPGTPVEVPGFPLTLIEVRVCWDSRLHLPEGGGAFSHLCLTSTSAKSRGLPSGPTPRA
jgi:hypothetical protein